MRLVHTESAVDGARLAMDVYGGQSAATPLLRAGVELDDRYRRALAGAGVARVLVEDADSEGILVKPALPQAARTEAATRYGALLDQCRGAFARGERMPWDAVAEAEKIAFLLREESLTDDDSAVVLVDTTGAAAYRVQHAIDTTVLGLRIARRLFGERGRVTGGGGRSTEGIDDALRRLALGLLLHDLGIGDGTDNFFVLDGSVIDPPAEEERSHVERGHDFLPHFVVSAHAAAVVRAHHERWDGRGPNGFIADRIPQFARIAAVADVFDALTSERPDLPAVAPHIAFSAIARGADTLFDPEVVEVFSAVVAPYPPGTEVTLSDGSAGLVSAVPTTAPHRPLVRLLRDPSGQRVEPREVSLAQSGGLTIARAA